MSRDTISIVAFVGSLGVIALTLFGQVSAKHGILIGGGLMLTGFVVRPTSASA